MLILIAILLGVFILAMIAGTIHNRRVNRQIANGELSEEPDIVIKNEECDACNTTPGSEGCELDCVLQKAHTEIVYYDDEELDRFKGRSSDSYTEEEIEEFSEIMYPCREEEVPAWNRSLELRGIQFPDQLKDELYMLINEQTHKA